MSPAANDSRSGRTALCRYNPLAVGEVSSAAEKKKKLKLATRLTLDTHVVALQTQMRLFVQLKNHSPPAVGSRKQENRNKRESVLHPWTKRKDG